MHTMGSRCVIYNGNPSLNWVTDDDDGSSRTGLTTSRPNTDSEKGPEALVTNTVAGVVVSAVVVKFTRLGARSFRVQGIVLTQILRREELSFVFQNTVTSKITGAAETKVISKERKIQVLPLISSAAMVLLTLPASIAPIH